MSCCRSACGPKSGGIPATIVSCCRVLVLRRLLTWPLPCMARKLTHDFGGGCCW